MPWTQLRSGWQGVMAGPTAIDERSVSWKVLLPLDSGSRALAIGLDLGGVAGLARSFGEVACLDEEGTLRSMLESAGAVLWRVRDRITPVAKVGDLRRPYDCVAVGHGAPGEVPRPQELADLLAPGGLLVCLGFAGCAWTGRDLRKAGFPAVQRYAALPRGQPRVFFPTESKALRAKGLRFHVPGSLRARRALALVSVLNRLGLRFPLSRRGLLMASRNASRPKGEGLGQWVSQVVGRPVEGLVVYAGSDSPNRKITALAVSEGGDEDVVVRVADTPAAERAVCRESDALRALAGSPVAGQVPRLVHEGHYGAHAVHVQGALPPGRHVAQLTDAHRAFLVSLSNLGRATVPLCSTNLWRSVKETAARLTAADLPDAVRSVLHRVLDLRFASRPVVCHRIHGDFAPWNIRWNGKRLFVFDWEDSDPQGPALTDMYHFLYRQASLVGPWRGEQQMLRILREAGSRLTRAAGLPPDLQDTVLPVLMLAEYFRGPCRHMEDLMAAVMGGAM